MKSTSANDFQGKVKPQIWQERSYSVLVGRWSQRQKSYPQL